MTAYENVDLAAQIAKNPLSVDELLSRFGRSKNIFLPNCPAENSREWPLPGFGEKSGNDSLR